MVIQESGEEGFLEVHRSAYLSQGRRVCMGNGSLRSCRRPAGLSAQPATAPQDTAFPRSLPLRLQEAKEGGLRTQSVPVGP